MTTVIYILTCDMGLQKESSTIYTGNRYQNTMPDLEALANNQLIRMKHKRFPSNHTSSIKWHQKLMLLKNFKISSRSIPNVAVLTKTSSSNKFSFQESSGKISTLCWHWLTNGPALCNIPLRSWHNRYTFPAVFDNKLPNAPDATWFRKPEGYCAACKVVSLA